MSGVANDDDSPAEAITYSLVSNSNETAVDAQVEQNSLNITRLTAEEATSILTLRATSGDLYVDFTVNVILNLVVNVRSYETEMSIYPNPTDGQITISIPQSTGYDYTISNMIGQEVMYGHSFGETTQLDLSGLNKGIYNINIQVENTSYVQKIVVR